LFLPDEHTLAIESIDSRAARQFLVLRLNTAGGSPASHARETKVMEDPRISKMMDPANMPFDMSRMA
jgi:uncharacterized protein YbaA (DUF1428 family)